MPRKINLKEIARKNPHIDLEQLRAGMRLRQALLESGLNKGFSRGCGVPRDNRARIVDDAEDDPRLIRLQQ